MKLFLLLLDFRSEHPLLIGVDGVQNLVDGGQKVGIAYAIPFYLYYVC